MTFVIRPAVPDDRERIREILVATALFRGDQIEAALELVELALRNSGKAEYTVRVAADQEAEQAIVHGYVCFGPMPNTEGVFDLYWIAVDPARQGEGIGRLLLRFTEEEVRRNAGRTLLIETSSRPSYELTRRFYARSGYQEVSRIKDFYRVEDDKVIFGKQL